MVEVVEGDEEDECGVVAGRNVKCSLRKVKPDVFLATMSVKSILPAVSQQHFLRSGLHWTPT